MDEKLVGKNIGNGMYDLGNGLAARVLEPRVRKTEEELKEELRQKQLEEERQQQEAIKEKEMSLDKAVNIINLEARRQGVVTKAKEYKEAGAKLAQAVGTNEEDRSIIDRRLETVTIEELLQKVKTPEGIDWFFTDDSGNVLSIAYKKKVSKEEELEFKKGLLIYLKQVDSYMEEIDKADEELRLAQEEFDTNIKESVDLLSDNIMMVVHELRQVAANSPNYAKLNRRADFIESGYTYQCIKRLAIDHPTIVKNTVNDMKVEGRIKELGDRYRAKLKTAKASGNLFPFLSRDGDVSTSLEFQVLKPDDYQPGTEDLFMFILIRYFAMESWAYDDAVRAFHSASMIVLSKLVTGKLPEDVKERVIVNIKEVLKPYQDAFKASLES